MPGQAKGLIGTVVSNKMSKTVVVLVETTTRHRLYHKILRRSKRYQAHDDRLEAKPGDRVRILATRPISRHKRWRVSEILQRGEVAEVASREIDSEYFGRKRERAPVEDAPATEAKPQAVAEAPATEAEAPAAEAEPQAEGEAPATEAEAPAAEETPAAEAEAPATEETPATEAEAPAADEAPATEAEPAEEPPTVEEPATDEPKPAEEPTPEEPASGETTEERDAP
ncbi:MAG: 30S ribosomal protein S17 [Chloroflexi bacterium]|nr:30S ribosomal protein S17 [Chloroflexota bacterium]